MNGEAASAVSPIESGGRNVLINAVCPFCTNRFQVSESLRGKRMRCPNSRCGEVFTVPEAEAPRGATPERDSTPKSAPTSSSVGDLIPILPAESVKPLPPEPPQKGDHITDLVPFVEARAVPQEMTWNEPPPVRAPGKSEPTSARRERKSKPPPPEPDLPAQVQVADWRAAPPPLSRSSSDEVVPEPVHESPPSTAAIEEPATEAPPKTTEAAQAELPSETTEEEDHAQKKKSKARRMMAVMAVAVVVVLGGAGAVAWMVLSESEDRIYADAMKAYKDERFGYAADRFRVLLERFPEAGRKGEVVLRARIAGLRAELVDAPQGTDAALTKVGDFLAERPPEATERELLEEEAPGIGQSLLKLADDFFRGQDTSNDEALRGVLNHLVQRIDQFKKRFPKAFKAEDLARIDDAVREKLKAVDLAAERQLALGLMREWLADASVEKLRKAEEFRRRKSRQIPGFDKDPEVEAILKEMRAKILEKTRYIPGELNLAGAELAAIEDREAGILVDPLVGGKEYPAGSGQRVLLALARGVLYALDPVSGKIRWAMRVGADTNQLPVRLPPSAGHAGERLLILAGDARTLILLDQSGKNPRTYHLGSPCLGQPVIVRNRAYLATFDGQVHEIELSEGRALGRYQLGHPLTIGGVHRRGTDLIYFPADDSCVFVVDVAKQKCVKVLHTNHPGGSLRCEPVILGDGERRGPASEARPPCLVLSQSNGMDETLFRLWELPPPDSADDPTPLPVEPRTGGWIWFSPYHDHEKVVCLTDQGRLGLYGIRQEGNPHDPLLFPLVAPTPGREESRSAGIDLTPYLTGSGTQQRGRALVASVQGDEFWLLARGQFQRLALPMSGGLGPRPQALWKQPLALGSPQHAAQTTESADGQPRLFLVTQPLRRPVCLASAIDPEASEEVSALDRRIVWQRQLGLLCRGEPLTLGGELLTLDQGGGLFRFDPRHFKESSAGEWLVGGQAVAPSFDHDTAWPPVLLSGEGRTAYRVSLSVNGSRLIVRQYDAPDPALKEGKFTTDEQEAELPGGRPGGNVAVQGGSLLVPLSNGTLYRYPLPLTAGAKPGAGPTWRGSRAPADARCFVTAPGKDECLTTDGDRGLTRWQWAQGQVPYKAVLPTGQTEPPTVELPARIVAPPLVLPREKEDDPLRVLVADARGFITLLRGETLQQVRNWELKGNITSGPFLREGRAGVIVDRTRLVWLDPDRAEPLWQHDTGGPIIIGEPVVVEGLVVVADDGGRFVGLDPATGKPAGEPFVLRGALAPAASPVAFGPGRAFAPLTDGTVMLLTVENLRGPWWRRPLFEK